MESQSSCYSCQKKSAGIVCDCCQKSVCKSCAEFVTLEQFHYLEQPPSFFKAGAICWNCFNETVAPFIAEYESNLEKAKEIQFYEKNQGKETRLIKRNHEVFRVDNCSDYRDAVMKLAYRAVKAGYNALIETDIKARKHKIGTYTTSIWSGTAVPANLEPGRVVKDRSLWQNPN